MTKYQVIILLLSMAFVLGATVGSFLNVCIYRIPEGLSVVSPRSRCPHCEQPIPWYLNIPILSWIGLRGKCLNCKASISVRYPLIEGLNGLLYALVLYYLPVDWSFNSFPWVFPVFFAFVSMLVVITFIDLDHQIIPNAISLPGTLFGFLSSFLVPWLSWYESLAGIAAGAGFLLLVAVGYQRLAGKEGMGMGDVKLLAMIGAFLGWQAILPVVFIASLVGSFVGVPMMLWRRADGKLALPFGPFLSLAAVVYLLWWDPLLAWYQSLFY